MNPDLLKQTLYDLAEQGDNGTAATIKCDKCGRVEAYRPSTTVADIQTVEGFMDIKTYWADAGWKVSVGYDLCPNCIDKQ